MERIFLDANIYIGSNYSFGNIYFQKLSELISKGELTLLGCSICIGEVEKHIESDLNSAVSGFNKSLKSRSFAAIRYDDNYKVKLEKLDTKIVVEHVVDNFRRYLDVNQLETFSLEGISTENLIQDFFDKKSPFEEKKPNEFKDAIMIKALKKYQDQIGENIIVISNDEGFRKSVKDDKGFVVFEKLADFLKYHQRNNKLQQAFEEYFSDDNDYDDICNALSDFAEGIDYSMDEREEFQITNFAVDAVEYGLDYVEIEEDDKIKAFVAATFSIIIECEYLDVDNSYYDKEDTEYVVKSYIQAKEEHQFEQEIVLEFRYQEDEKNESCEFSFIEVNSDECDNSLDLSLEDTCIDCYNEKSVMSKQNKDYLDNYGVQCSECGKFLGFSNDGNFHTYDGEPLCNSCAVTNENGFICPQCGLKHSYERQGNSGDFCIDCEREYDH